MTFDNLPRYRAVNGQLIDAQPDGEWVRFSDLEAALSTEQPEDALPDAQRIPIKAAKQIAREYGYDQVVIFARAHRFDNKEHVTTYGKTVEDCDVAARMGNHLKRVVGWPEEKCNAIPRRMKQALYTTCGYAGGERDELACVLLKGHDADLHVDRYGGRFGNE